MLHMILSFLVAIRAFFRSRSDTALEVLALRQQVAVLKRKRPRPKLNSWDRLFWTALRQCWSRWADVLVLMKPDTVIGWHRAGFRLYWRWRSRPRGGRPKITEEIRVLIRRLAQENQHWGAPKIHGERQKRGFVVSERSVARYLRRMQRRCDPARNWLTFLLLPPWPLTNKIRVNPVPAINAAKIESDFRVPKRSMTAPQMSMATILGRL